MRSEFYQYLQQQRDRLLSIFVPGPDLGFIKGLCDDPAFPRPDHLIKPPELQPSTGQKAERSGLIDNVYHSPHPGVAGI